MTYTGRCACGAVALEITGEPVTTAQCWCRQCQKIAAGGPTNNAYFPTGTVTISGAMTESSWPAANGNTLSFRFCQKCGSQVWGQSSAHSELTTIRLGILDEPHGLRPALAIWTEDAPAWAHFDPDLPRRRRQGPDSGD